MSESYYPRHASMAIEKLAAVVRDENYRAWRRREGGTETWWQKLDDFARGRFSETYSARDELFPEPSRCIR